MQRCLKNWNFEELITIEKNIDWSFNRKALIIEHFFSKKKKKFNTFERSTILFHYCIVLNPDADAFEISIWRHPLVLK